MASGLQSNCLASGYWDIEGWTVRKNDGTGMWDISKSGVTAAEVATLGEAREWIAAELGRITPVGDGEP